MVCYSPNFLKVTIIEDQKVLILIVKALHVVRNTFREIPDVAFFQLFGRELAIFIHTGKQERARV